jgi:hypothetical protein
MIICFVDIGGIDDHHWLSFLFCVHWVKMRGYCFADIDGIDCHHCLNFLFCVQWVNEHKKENLISDGHQFHQYQQNK